MVNRQEQAQIALHTPISLSERRRPESARYAAFRARAYRPRYESICSGETLRSSTFTLASRRIGFTPARDAAQHIQTNARRCGEQIRI